MGIVNKYKVNELAKDFGMQTREIIDILGKYFDTPKKSGQNLDEKELNTVFEYLTQHNQVSGIQVIFADAAPAKPKSAPPAQQAQGGGKPQQAQAQPQQGGGKQQPAQGGAQPAQSAGKPQAAAQPQQPQQAQQTRQSMPRQTKVVDTRKATNVNLDKYDE